MVKIEKKTMHAQSPSNPFITPNTPNAYRGAKNAHYAHKSAGSRLIIQSISDPERVSAFKSRINSRLI